MSVFAVALQAFAAKGAICFTPTAKPARNYLGSSTSRTSQLFAKPPPKNSFDLEAIEAFEKQLEKEEASTNNKDADENSGGGDEDGELISSSPNEDVKLYEIKSEMDNMRIDLAIHQFEPELSRSHCGSLVKDGKVLVSSSGDGNAFTAMKRKAYNCLLYTSPSPRDAHESRMPSSA